MHNGLFCKAVKKSGGKNTETKSVSAASPLNKQCISPSSDSVGHFLTSNTKNQRVKNSALALVSQSVSKIPAAKHSCLDLSLAVFNVFFIDTNKCHGSVDLPSPPVIMTVSDHLREPAILHYFGKDLFQKKKVQKCSKRFYGSSYITVKKKKFPIPNI